jgi:hypothetical protein
MTRIFVYFNEKMGRSLALSAIPPAVEDSCGEENIPRCCFSVDSSEGCGTLSLAR